MAMTSHPGSGFTLVEMAVVMVVMGLVMMAVFPALNSVRSSGQQALTHSNLRSLMLATAAYVQANGCLPCPASASATGSNFGRMGYAAAATACGTCPVAEGIPPFVSLGLPASTAHDGWGYWFTMRVDPALTSLPSNVAGCGSNCSVFTPPTALCTLTDVNNGFCPAPPNGSPAGSSSGATKGLCRSGLSTANRISVALPGGGAQQAAVIFVSHGSAGYGSFVAQPLGNGNNGYRLPFPSNYASCSASGGYAVCNASNSAQFYDAPAVVSNFDPYDDILAYADRNSLVSMLGNGSCQTVW